jgi:tRNA(Ile)-lysidine synthase
MELVAPSSVYNSDVNALDSAKCRGSLQLRNWRPGDQFERPGSGAAVKIKTLFQDFRIPLWERRRWPVILQGESIVWTRRFGAAKQFAASPETESVLLVRDVAGGKSEGDTPGGIELTPVSV